MLNTKVIERLKSQFPNTYHKLKKGAMRRFKFQQISLAHQLQKYLSMCQDELPEPEPELLERFNITNKKLDRQFRESMYQLPAGVCIPGHAYLNYFKVNKLKTQYGINPS